VACLASTPSAEGYWLVASDGGVFAFGDARFLGSTGAMRLSAPVVGMASAPSGSGYWLVASDGGIFAFGDAPFLGSTGAVRLNQPVVGLAVTRSGGGYWLVASDGGIFAFGDAHFLGSTGALPLNAPVVGMAPTPSGRGYWLVASDGGVFSFGDARYWGSAAAVHLNAPVVGMAATPSGNGYWLAAADGGIFSFGDARFLGSTTGAAASTVGIAARRGAGSCHGPVPVVAAAGDIACEPGRPRTASECHEGGTAAAISALRPAAVLTLGDNQYEDGSLLKFQQSFAATWGRIGVPLHPAAGNHDFGVPGARGYFAYFGAAAGEAGRGWYSFDLGGWHLVALNSNCGAIGGCAAGSPQERWLRADLAAHRAGCTLAYWHHPRFSSGPHGDEPATGPLWQALSDAGTDLVLTGHDHLYERFAPLTAAGAPDPAGIREFVVGTGGRSLYPVVRPHAHSEFRLAGTFGVLALDLDAGAYQWRFLAETGAILDRGRASCH
jgi:hypothetical protein